MRRVSELWTRLAQEIQTSDLRTAQVRRPRDLARPRNDAVQIGDILRDRLRNIAEDHEGSDN